MSLSPTPLVDLTLILFICACLSPGKKLLLFPFLFLCNWDLRCPTSFRQGTWLFWFPPVLSLSVVNRASFLVPNKKRENTTIFFFRMQSFPVWNRKKKRHNKLVSRMKEVLLIAPFLKFPSLSYFQTICHQKSLTCYKCQESGRGQKWSGETGRKILPRSSNCLKLIISPCLPFQKGNRKNRSSSQRLKHEETTNLCDI